MLVVYIFVVSIRSFYNVKIGYLFVNAIFSLTKNLKHQNNLFGLVVRSFADDSSELAESLPAHRPVSACIT